MRISAASSHECGVENERDEPLNDMLVAPVV